MRFFKRKKRQFEIVKGQMRKHGGIEIKLPQRGTKNAIAYDIFSPIDFIVKPGEKFMLWTDVKAKFNDDEALIIGDKQTHKIYEYKKALRTFKIDFQRQDQEEEVQERILFKFKNIEVIKR